MGPTSGLEAPSAATPDGGEVGLWRRRFPGRKLAGVALLVVAGWWLFVADTAADNDVLGGLRRLGTGIADLPRLLTSTAGYRSWWRYVNEQEGWDRILGNVVEHVQLVGVSMLAATLIAVTAGIAAHRVRALRGPLLGVASVMLTIPSLALFALFISIPGIGIGDRGPLIALTMYSILPILRNTTTGLDGVDRAVVEAAKGVGVGARRRLLMIELPLAWPVILTGIRVAVLLNIGIAAIAALVGGTGLGGYINDGLQRFPNVTSMERIWTGVIFSVLLAVVADGCFYALRWLTTSKGLRR